MEIFLAIVYLLVSLILGLLVTFSTTRLFIRTIRRKYNITHQNTSFAILLASVIFSVGYIISGVLEPAFKMIATVRMLEKNGADVFFSVVKYGTIFGIVGFVVSFLVIFLAMYLFNFLNTEIEELEEISNNNIAVGILVGTIIIVITLFVKGSIIFFLENLIPYSELPRNIG